MPTSSEEEWLGCFDGQGHRGEDAVGLRRPGHVHLPGEALRRWQVEARVAFGHSDDVSAAHAHRDCSCSMADSEGQAATVSAGNVSGEAPFTFEGAWGDHSARRAAPDVAASHDRPDDPADGEDGHDDGGETIDYVCWRRGESARQCSG